MTQDMQNHIEEVTQGVSSTASLHAVVAELTQSMSVMQQEMRALNKLRTQLGDGEVPESNPFAIELQASVRQRQTNIVVQLQKALAELDRMCDEVEGKAAMLGNIYDRQKALCAAKRSMQRYFEGHCKLQAEQRRTYEALVSVQQAQLGSIASTAAEVQRTQRQRRLLRVVWTHWLKRAMIYAFSRHCVALQQASLARWYALAQHVTSSRYAAREQLRRALQLWSRRTERRVRLRLQTAVQTSVRQLHEAQECDAAGQQLLRSQLAATQSSAAHTHHTQSRQCALLEDEATRLRRQMHEMTREFHERTATYVKQQAASERYMQTRETAMQQAVLCMQAELDQQREKDRCLVGHVAVLQDRLQDYHVRLEDALWQGMMHKGQIFAAVAAEQMECMRQRCDAMRAETAQLHRDIAILAPLSEEVLRWESRTASAEARLQHVDAERQQLLAQLAQAERVCDVFTSRMERCTRQTLRGRYFVRWAQRALGATLQASRQQCHSLNNALQAQEKAAMAERQEWQIAQQASLAQLQGELDSVQHQCGVLAQEKQYALQAWQACDQQHCQTQTELAELQARWAQHTRQQQGALETIHRQQCALILLDETAQRGMLALSELGWYDTLRGRELRAWQVYACGSARQLLELRQETETWRAQAELQIVQQRVRRQRSLTTCAVSAARAVHHVQLLRWWLRWRIYTRERRAEASRQDAVACSTEIATQRHTVALRKAAQQHRNALAQRQAAHEAELSALRDEHASALRALAMRHEAVLREAVARERSEAQRTVRCQCDEADRTTDRLGRLLVEYCARSFFARWRTWCAARHIYKLQRQVPWFLAQCRQWYGLQVSLVVQYYSTAQLYCERTTMSAALLLLRHPTHLRPHTPPSPIDAATPTFAVRPTHDAATSPLHASSRAVAATGDGDDGSDAVEKGALHRAVTALPYAAVGGTSARQASGATRRLAAEEDGDAAACAHSRDRTSSETALCLAATQAAGGERAGEFAGNETLSSWLVATAVGYLSEMFDLVEIHARAGEQLYELAVRHARRVPAAGAHVEDVVVSPTTPLLRGTQDEEARDDPLPTVAVIAATHETKGERDDDDATQESRNVEVTRSSHEVVRLPSPSTTVTTMMKGGADVLRDSVTTAVVPSAMAPTARTPERPRAADEADTHSQHNVDTTTGSAAVTTATTCSYTAEAPQQGLTNSPSPCEVSALTSECGSSSGSVARGQSSTRQTPHVPTAADAALVVDVAAQTPPRSDEAATETLHTQLQRTRTALAETRRSLCLLLVEQEQLAQRMHRAATRRWGRGGAEVNTNSNVARWQRCGGATASRQVQTTGQYAAMLEQQQQQQQQQRQRQRSAPSESHGLERKLDFWCEQLRLLSARWQAVVTEAATAATPTESEEGEVHDWSVDETCSADYLLRVMDGHTHALQCRLTANAAELQELRRRWHRARLGDGGATVAAAVVGTTITGRNPDAASRTPRSVEHGGTSTLMPATGQVLRELRERLHTSWSAYTNVVEACMRAVRALPPPPVAAQTATESNRTPWHEERGVADGETATATSSLRRLPSGGRPERDAPASDDAEVSDFVNELLAHFAPHVRSTTTTPPASPATADADAVSQTLPGRDLRADLHAVCDDAVEAGDATATTSTAALLTAAEHGAAEESPTKRRLRDQVRLLERMLVESKLQLAEVKAMLDDSRQHARCDDRLVATCVSDGSRAQTSPIVALRDTRSCVNDAAGSAEHSGDGSTSAVHEQEMMALMATLRQVRALDMDERRRLAAQLQEQMHRAVNLVRDHAAQAAHGAELELQTLRTTMQERLDRAASNEAALRAELQLQISTRTTQEQEAERVLQSVRESFQREMRGLVDAYDTARAELATAMQRHTAELEAQSRAFASERQRLQRDVANAEKRAQQTEADLDSLRAQHSSLTQHELIELTRQHHEEVQQLQARCSALRQELQYQRNGPSPAAASFALLCTRVLQHTSGLAAMAQVVLSRKADYALHYCGRLWAVTAVAQQKAVDDLQRNAASEREALETELVRLHERVAFLLQNNPAASRQLDAVAMQSDRIDSELGKAEDGESADVTHADVQESQAHAPATDSATQTPSSSASLASTTARMPPSSAAATNIDNELPATCSTLSHHAPPSSSPRVTQASLSLSMSSPQQQRRASSATQTPVGVRSSSLDSLELSQQVLRYSAQLSLQRERNMARRSSADALTARLDQLLHEGTRLQQLIEEQPM